ncbi:M15 family metallopeptidase [Catellatospora chokoriensis]|uniref:D-alanyl-D-alanine dipeptidase n=1 Tax=Catellatospora chokoriensis TaxID=310353 RepID=A0A8J3NV65_9ACTN|nr:M15 family metallopeptidase [Catellatospora chokoriensis]GIF93613.1 D-alanyl-D-alanine dipeptidase [Catellatospora chokoriensis]
MDDIVLLSDPAIAAIEVAENHEPLVDLRTVPTLRIDPRLADPAGAYAHVRAGLAERLVKAQALLPRQLRLLVVEGYRPLALQVEYFEARVAKLRPHHPDRDETWLQRQASTYISPPHVAPHVAGAAVDLTLATDDGHELWLGTEVNDSDTTACHTDSPRITPEAAELRQVLGDVLRAAGLVNYPTEWWHWSYGDRYWAHHSGLTQAPYGPVAHLPES